MAQSSDNMSRRSAPRSAESYSNGWDNHQADVPSYMSSATPPTSETNGSTNDIQTKIKRLKRRRPNVVTTRAYENPISKLYSRMVHGEVSKHVALLTAIMLWYLLGVVSIGTTKLLLNQGVPPLYLTIQQLFLGSNLLRLLLYVKALGSVGLAPWPKESSMSPVRRTQQKPKEAGSFWNWHLRDLVLSGVYFALGFAGTNLSFSGASAAFVETVKAAEPITSAATAVAWGIEVLSIQEGASLVTIVAGVLISTLGNSKGGGSEGAPLSQSLRSSATVMMANLCFSFRGLHQKLFRATPHGSKNSVDDLNLQFRMQQIGMMVLAVPVLIWDTRTLLSIVVQPREMAPTLDFLALALINGFAFTSYNLASTFVLTRISVVHHAALNCIRRIFAIIVTSIAFQIPITPVGALGIMVSFGGFMAFTLFKVKRQRQPKPISTLLPMSAV